MVFLVITDAVKTLMMIIGVVVIVRFMKNVFATKHAAASIKQFDAKKKQFEEEKRKAAKNQGKIIITANSSVVHDIEDVDFEEVR